MKKLLALVLCVMLFISVIPTSAFAKSSISGSTIDLSPAYEARNNLFVAYAKLGGATAVKNSYNGVDAYTKLFNATNNPNALAAANKVKALFTLDKITEFVAGIKTGLTPAALFAMIAPDFVEGYNSIGSGVALDCKTKEDNVAAAATKTYNDMVDTVKASTAAAVAALLPNVE